MLPPRLAAFIAVVFWGISFVATKTALRDVSPVTLIATRFVIGAAVLLLIVRELPPRSAWGRSTGRSAGPRPAVSRKALLMTPASGRLVALFTRSARACPR